MREYWSNRLKKLALAFGTGWEYRPGEEEAGSVVADVFLDMMEENWSRYERLWEKQELEFQQAVPRYEEEPPGLKSAVCIEAFGSGGIRLEEGTGAEAESEDGRYLSFALCHGTVITNARLRYILYAGNGAWWISYDRERREEMPEIPLFEPCGEQVSHPVFSWKADSLCNGLSVCRWEAEFAAKDGEAVRALLKAQEEGAAFFTVSDGRRACLLRLETREGKLVLAGETAAFASALEPASCEIRLDVTEPDGGIRRLENMVVGNLRLREERDCFAPEILLTPDGAAREGDILPFGGSPEAPACLYIACDGALARDNGAVTLEFDESCRTEELLPEKPSPAYEKALRKYPWMAVREPVREWKPSETVWEYFDGALWCALPGTAELPRVLGAGEGRRSFSFRRPADMRPCVVEGEEHFYVRLRLTKASNAYAPYYIKRIPVMSGICFAVEGRRRECVFQVSEAPSGPEEAGYFGFDAPVTEENSLVALIRNEADGQLIQKPFTPTAEQIKGWRTYGGRDAWWLEVKPPQKGGETAGPYVLTDLKCNYVRVAQRPGGADSASAFSEGEAVFDGREKAPEDILPAGTAFWVEGGENGPLRAVSVADACYDRAGAPYRDTLENAEQYFVHFRRLLTLRDVRCLCRERYPFLGNVSCHVEKPKDGKESVLVLEWDGAPDTARKEGALGNTQRTLGSAQRTQGHTLCSEIGEWLQTVVGRSGNLWLSECRVEVRAAVGAAAPDKKGGKRYAGESETG